METLLAGTSLKELHTAFQVGTLLLLVSVSVLACTGFTPLRAIASVIGISLLFLAANVTAFSVAAGRNPIVPVIVMEKKPEDITLDDVVAVGGNRLFQGLYHPSVSPDPVPAPRAHVHLSLSVFRRGKGQEKGAQDVRLLCG